jgi:hypothetical protein
MNELTWLKSWGQHKEAFLNIEITVGFFVGMTICLGSILSLIVVMKLLGVIA